MHIKRIRHGLVAAGLFSAQAAWAGAPTELRIAAQEETAPKYIKSDAGAGVGMCVDLVQALERTDPELRFVGGERWMHLVRVLTELSAGQLDAGCGLARTREREKRMTFLKPALTSLDFVLVARAGDNVDVNNWDDVRKLGRHGVVLGNRGLFASGFLAAVDGIHYDTGSATSAQNLHKLVRGRGRFFFQRKQGLNEMLREAGVFERVRVLPAVMGSTRLYFTLGKHVDVKATERVQRALIRLQTTGELERIRKRWY